MKLLQSIKAKLSTPLRGFIANESGATMTEFIITLPIFILIFAGIANLSRLNKAVVRTSGVAYSDMWDNALKVQKGSPGTHTSARHSGTAIKENMKTYRDKQPENYVRQVVRRETNRHGDGLTLNGTLGESNARVKAPHNAIKFRAIHSDLTPNINSVVGKSSYGKRLFDDSSSARSFTYSSSGSFASLNAKLSGPAATRMVHATRAHYGEEMGTDKQTVVIAGQKFHIHQYYNTLVSPGWQREDAAAAVTRTALNGIPAYDNMLGIAKNQRLSKKTQSVKKIKGAM